MALRLAVPAFILVMGNSDLAGEQSKWGKLKIADEVAKFRRRGTQSEIMAHARCQAAIHPRLVRVPLPRMQVNTTGGVLRDGKAGSAVPAHWSPTTVLKQLLRAPCVLSKLIPRHLIHSSMAQTVAGNLVASLGDALDDVWMLLCDPAQGEKCGFASRFVKQVKQNSRISLDTAQLRMPLLGSNRVTERGYMVVVLEVDGERVFHANPRILQFTQPWKLRSPDQTPREGTAITREARDLPTVFLCGLPSTGIPLISNDLSLCFTTGGSVREISEAPNRYFVEQSCHRRAGGLAGAVTTPRGVTPNPGRPTIDPLDARHGPRECLREGSLSADINLHQPVS